MTHRSTCLPEQSHQPGARLRTGVTSRRRCRFAFNLAMETTGGDVYTYRECFFDERVHPTTRHDPKDRRPKPK